jgi:aminopeptidase-like protein
MEHPLNVISYSLSVNKVVSKDELMQHLHTNPEHPDAIPFVYKYYDRDWGFCIEQNKLINFVKDSYRVVIDSEFVPDNLNVGEYVISGQEDNEIVILSHLCHPAQVNDDLAGVAVAVKVASEISKIKTKYSYRFLFLPETVGSVAYLSQNEHLISKMKYAVFLEMLGTNNPLWLQHSRQKNTLVDRVAKYVLEKSTTDSMEGDYLKVVCNDEKVFNSYGVNIPTISISRALDKNGKIYPQYHTNADNPENVNWANLEKAESCVLKIIDVMEKNYIPVPQYKGPLFLSGLGLYADFSKNPKLLSHMYDIMNDIDGSNSLFDICERYNLDFDFWISLMEKFSKLKLIIKKPCY